MVKHVKVENLRLETTDHFDLFICSASFEDRCSTIASNLLPSNIGRALICTNRDYDEYIKDNLQMLTELFTGIYQIADVFSSSPLKSADNIEEALNELSAGKSPQSILLDITTFTHESLLILLAILNNKYPTTKVTCCYVNAKEYSIDSTKQEDKWLSIGVGEVRTILGYAGTIKPSLKTHLIVVVGYEHERATKIIERLEPDTLSLGYGEASDATTEKNRGANKQFVDLIKEMSVYYENVSEFVVPCNSPYNACKAILNEVNRIGPDKNIIIVPMNNKISTIGVALACFQKKDIQLCYAPALIYNYLSYSVPGDKCYFFNLDVSPELSKH